MNETIFARVELEVKEAIAKCADIDDRNSSYVVRLAVIKFLKEKGLLSQDFGAKKVVDTPVKKAKK